MKATVASAFPARRDRDAAALVFEYMAATLAETGRPTPAGVADLPPVLRHECCSLPDVYRLPGSLLVADWGGQPAGCVGLAPCAEERTAEIKRLYVRPAYRRQGIARTLMDHAHDHAARHGVTRLILDVLPVRTAVVAFYRRLGYAETEPYATESPVPMLYLARRITRDDGH